MFRGRGIAVGGMAVLAMVFVACAGSARADDLTTLDQFWVTFDVNGQLVAGGGSGYGDGTWYYYENTEWWNQWFYDHPYDPDRWKEIDLGFTIQPSDPTYGGYYIELVINWSTPEWSADGVTDNPPLPPLTPNDEGLYIARELVWSGEFCGVQEFVLEDFIIPDYNPEWISIDVRGMGFEIVEGTGWIRHSCLIPEPATLSLFGLGAAGLLAARLRRRRE